MLERYELEMFLTLAEELHFGRTAERTHVSTARVSQTIRKLERRVGAPLFNRTSRRVELTPLGRDLYEDLGPARDQIVAAVERAITSARGITGTLQAGYLTAAGAQLLLQAADVLKTRQPPAGLDVIVREVQLADAVPWLLGGEIQVLLTCFDTEHAILATGPPLITEARMLAVPSTHPLASRHSVSTNDLTNLTVLHTSDRSGAGRSVGESGPEAASFHELLTLVGAGRGVFPISAHLRRYYMRPDVAYIPFRDAPPVHWRLMWRTDRPTAQVVAYAAALQALLTT
ncbi:LysR family transcriptional regulator [Kribbella sp. NPDC048928]|uniref:LysR family transcriptional regulator n=1 Tax=Kribbella sp. NPDC048928 TaxID=3364111 RepID=UPI003721050C